MVAGRKDNLLRVICNINFSDISHGSANATPFRQQATERYCY
ncbi:hypothetical protein BN439_3341 [Erwinia amylovora Ea644]|nr:hypothetical protein BN439_3341 [Erwinia amylovora Ea644]CCP08436.1 hypothetical protein BN440_3440 [Erwinia amylovora MR1]